MGLALVVIFASCLVLIVLIFLLLTKHKIKSNANGSLPLPPGSMGYPYIGETLQFYSQDPNTFFASKQRRYGEIFKTHMLGCPCVMLTTPEAARFVLVTNAHLFKPTYPSSKEKMIGPWALMFHEGDYHRHVRRLVQGPLAPGTIRHLVGDINDMAVSMLESWVDGQLIRVLREMKTFSFDVGVLAIFGKLDQRRKEELWKNYNIVDKGYNSLPTNIFGTSYHKALQARKRLSEILTEIIAERREREVVKKDILGCLMNAGINDDQGELQVTDEQIVDILNGVLFAAKDTTASSLTWIVKYLHDNPKLLEAVKTEQMEIYEANGCGDRGLTWSQTRSMPLTHRVLLESLRMTSIISFTFREAVADVNYKGYLIPKGWKVMPLFRNIHHNPEFFQEPHKFDPSRFKVPPKPNTFLPFGNGAHACPGNELAKLEMFVLIHHLVTKLRWEVVGSKSDIEYGPFPVPKEELPAMFRREPSRC